MTFLYTARKAFDKNYGVPMSWEGYIEWSKLTHLQEIVSLDYMMNPDLIESDQGTDEYWKEILVGENKVVYWTGLYKSLSYVLRHVNLNDKFNLLAVAIDPQKECKNLGPDEFDFLGYDLLDQDYSVSALTNCGGFDESFLPADLNKLGLIDDFAKASNIQKKLLENNPEEYHADTSIFAVWRHKTIGR
jgi:hypothetical protein